MTPEVFFGQMAIKLEDQMESKGVYKTEESLEKLPNRPCKVYAVGGGLLNPGNGAVEPLPYKVGDHLIVRNNAWVEVEVDGEKFLIIDSSTVLCRVNHS